MKIFPIQGVHLWSKIQQNEEAELAVNKYQTKMESLKYYVLREGVCKSIDDEQFQKVEEQIGSTLPADYASFLVEYGGTTFDEDQGYVAFPILEECPAGEKGLFDVFFGIIPGDCYDIVEKYLTFKGRMPFNLLPIAYTGGDVLCLAIYGEDEGKVYFWFHEEEDVVDEGIEPSRDNLYLVAHSFEEFINSLELDEDD